VAQYARYAQFDGAHAAVHGRVVVLGAGGHPDDLRFDVLGDLAQPLEPVAGSGQAVERAGGGDDQRRRAGNPRPGRGLGIGLQMEALPRREEPDQVRRQGELAARRGGQRRQGIERLLDPQVLRSQEDPAIRPGFEQAARVAVDGEIHRHGVGMVEVQGQISRVPPARSTRHGAWTAIRMAKRPL